MRPCPKTMASKMFIITWGVLFILMFFSFASKVASTTELDNPSKSALILVFYFHLASLYYFSFD